MNDITANIETLKNISGVQMMSSRGIAGVAKKDHGKVCRDIRVMLEKLYSISEAESTRNPDLAYLTKQGVTCIQYDLNNPNAWEYWLDYEHSQCLVAGYDASRRMSIIRQWQSLKAEVKQLQTPVKPAQQEISMNNDILSLARVVAEATASATMKAVIDIVGIQKPQTLTNDQLAPVTTEPLQDSFDLQGTHHTQSEYVPVSELVWSCGLSDAACRRLTTYAGLPTTLTNGDRGHLLIHRESFMAAAQTLLNESTAPSGKLKRWQHPEFGGFTLRLKSSESDTEAK